MTGRWALSATAFGVALAACTQTQNTSTTTVTGASSAPVVTTASPSLSPALANGKAIFQTGKDIEGVAIRAKQTPLYPTCAACHRPDGSGGMKLSGGATSADLRHAAIMSGKHPYNDALLERAIATGIDNAGKPLDPVMPRWSLSKRDLHDVAYYVLTQLK